MNELRSLYRYRQLIVALTARDLKARYRGSILGFFWSLANPLLLLTVYTIVFTIFFPANAIQPYPLFLFAGILPWTFFSAATLESTGAISANAGLIKKVLFPAEALPLVVVLSHLVHFALALPVLVIATAGFALHGDIAMRPTMLLAIPLMLLQTFLGTYRQRLEPAGGLMWSVDARATQVSHTRLDRSATPARRLLSPYIGPRLAQA